MQIAKSDYQALNEECPELKNELSAVFVTDDFQPQFSIELGWNEPKKLWRPFLCIVVWRWALRVGWLF